MAIRLNPVSDKVVSGTSLELSQSKAESYLSYKTIASANASSTLYSPLSSLD